MKESISHYISKDQSKHPLRIAIIVDDLFTNEHIYKFAAWASKQNNLCLSHVIINKHANSDITGFMLGINILRTISMKRLYDYASIFFFKAVLILEKFLLKKKRRYKNQYDRFKLTSVIKNQISISSISSDNYYCTLNGIETKRIKELKLDIIINYCNQFFYGDIVNSARLGVLSIQYAGTYNKSGYLPGFWEVYHKLDTTDFSINHLSNDMIGDGDVLIRGKFRTQVSFLLNQAALYEKTNYSLMQLIIKIASKKKIPPCFQSIPSSDYNHNHNVPKLHNSIYYLLDLYCRLIIKVIYQLIGYRRQFSVAFVHNDWRNAKLYQGISLKNPANHFLADPFILNRFGKNYCFVEDFDFSTRKGCIVVYEIEEKSSKRIGIAIEESFHMSFPFIFEYQGALFMCPETAEKKEIRIYRCIDFPLHWELELVIMKELSAVDTILFEKNGKWWLLTSIDNTNTGDYGQELSIFYADSPLSVDWKSHPQNPIYIDSTIVRNAGLLKDGDRLFRVSQASVFDIYGKKTSIFEIIDIDEFSYAENYIAETTPTFKKGIIGTHHIHSNGNITVFDYLDYSFIKI